MASEWKPCAYCPDCKTPIEGSEGNAALNIGCCPKCGFFPPKSEPNGLLYRWPTGAARRSGWFFTKTELREAKGGGA